MQIQCVLPTGPSELVLITLQKSVMGCSVNRFFQYNMYLQQYDCNFSLFCVICIVPDEYLFKETLTHVGYKSCEFSPWKVCDEFDISDNQFVIQHHVLEKLVFFRSGKRV